ncbi:hypothetical protein RN001_013943 [Aquatica leii]|uniref:HAT C-terminal dimerisation domain-containing protein n=1 Tax=Aquatica leii TaxID=1421715 RepID=A0AAN7P3G8_9COLE|nr:hypothetical protein RN001_013943 [Aquatica leii]
MRDSNYFLLTLIISRIYEILINLKIILKTNNWNYVKHLLNDKTRNKRDITAVEFKELQYLQKFDEKVITPPEETLNYITTNNLVDFFPNAGIIFRILLTMPVSVATTERSFSKLKIIKNYLRSTMGQNRLT